MKGKYHKAVGFAETERTSEECVQESEHDIMTQVIEELHALRNDETNGEYKSKSDLTGNEYLWENLRRLDHIRDRRGVSSTGRKDSGVGHPPRNRVKEDQEDIMVQGMYQGVGYSAKKGYINLEVNQGAPKPRQMNTEECEARVVGLVFAQMYSLRKGTELFGEKAEKPP